MKINRLRISRLPGFSKGLEGINELAGNVNIITGPNGSGKSSTARAIQKLIWWNDKTTDHEIDAILDINTELNEVKIDSQGYLRINKSKRTHEDLSFVFPREFSNQYMLALHDLINGRDDNLARIIAKEVNGGVDLSKAIGRLEYKFSIPNIAQPRYKQYIEIQKELINLENEQAVLLKNEGELARLEEEKKQSEEASGYKDLYEKLLNYINERNSYDRFNAQLNTYSPTMKKLKEDDFSTIEELEKKIAEIDITIFESEKIIGAYEEEVQLLRIADKDIPDELITELSGRIEDLKTLQQKVSSLEREISNQLVVKDKTGKLLNSEEELYGLRKLSLKDIHYLNEFIQAANEAEGIHSRLVSEKRRLEKELDELREIETKGKSIEDIRKGISILSDWLKGANPQPKMSIRLTLALGLAIWALLATVISYYGHEQGFVASIFISLLLVPGVIYLEGKREKFQSHELNVRMGDFEKSSLESPDNWDSDSVSSRLQELISDLDYLLRITKIEEQLKGVSIKLEQSQTRIKDIRSEYFNIKEGLGILPESIDLLINNYNSFYLFLSNLSKWQDAAIESEKLINEKENYYNSYLEELNAINSILSGFNFSSVEDPIQANAIYQALLKECEIKTKKSGDIKHQKSIIDIKEKEKKQYQLSLREIYSRLQIPFGKKDEVYFLTSQYESFKETENRVTDALAVVNANEQLLLNHPLCHIYKNLDKAITIERVRLKIEEYEYISGKQGEIIRQISDIEAQIRERRSKDDIEKALNDKEDALDGLNELLKNNLKAITGDLIVSHLHEEISLNNENPVFKRANTILGNITGSRYKLILGEGRQPVFKAYDSRLDQILSLDEISTGTRVQLLLAIRLAYIETQENQIKLPVLADELLANSDDERSEAIIRSLVEVSRNRQLFYFTAQAEEVSKWEEYLKKCSDIEWKTTLLVNS